MYSIKPSELTITEIKAKSIRVKKRKKIYMYILIKVYPCSIALDAFAEHGISESWTNQ